MVVEDSAHAYDTTMAALVGFAGFVPAGGFFVVEDGCVDIEPMRLRSTWPRGVLPAVDEWLMTPEGAVVGRPASTVRAGEERHVAARLAQLGIPICRTIGGQGTFEGADAMWLDAQTVLIGTGFRTNTQGARQLTDLLGEMGVTVLTTQLVKGAMHLILEIDVSGYSQSCCTATQYLLVSISLHRVDL